ncbi:hypothetical protein [Hirschia baltica]|uniref:hypothetical protein n=1 Tax=Hirschia baltica TaxID=2724 RepID=UPI00059E81E5|nr:hypothetical protein [Hirschia baltica]
MNSVFKPTSILASFTAFALLSACASNPAQTVEEKNDAAIAKCFQTFQNWPVARLDCISKIRGTEDPDAVVSDTLKTEKAD